MLLINAKMNLWRTDLAQANELPPKLMIYAKANDLRNKLTNYRQTVNLLSFGVSP